MFLPSTHCTVTALTVRLEDRRYMFVVRHLLVGRVPRMGHRTQHTQHNSDYRHPRLQFHNRTSAPQKYKRNTKAKHSGY